MSKKEYPVGSIVVSQNGKNKQRRIKVLPTGKGQPKRSYYEVWKPYAVYLWTKANGPVPDGLTVYHKNARPLDDRLENLAVGTVADRMEAYRRSRPKQWAKHHAKMSVRGRRSLKARFLGQKILGLVASSWYPVDHRAKTILNAPRLCKRESYIAAGIDRQLVDANYTKNKDGAAAVAMGWPGFTDVQAVVLTVMLDREWRSLSDIASMGRPEYKVRFGVIPKTYQGWWTVVRRLWLAGHLERRKTHGRVQWRLPPYSPLQRGVWTDYVPMKGKDAARLPYRRIDPRFGDVTEPTDSVLRRVLRIVKAEAKASKGAIISNKAARCPDRHPRPASD